jgi:DNA-binding transcriptional LysR family regulator
MINDEHRYGRQVQPVDRSDLVEIRQLEYVIAVAEELHFGHAAERMHVTQQSVSEQIRRLERELGTALFSRTSRRVVLTSAGETFLPEARRAVDAAQHALEVGRDAAQGHTGELRVGYAEDIGPRLLQLAVPLLSHRTPPVRVRPRPMSTPDQLAALADHRLDAAFGWHPDLTAELDSLPVVRAPLVVALSVDHLLATAPAVDPARLSDQPLILVPREVNPWLHDHITSQLVSLGVTVTVHEYASSLDRMVPLVLAGTGIGITSADVATERRVEGIVYRHFTEPRPSIESSLVWRRDTTSAAILDLVTVVRELRDSGALAPPDLEA